MENSKKELFLRQAVDTIFNNWTGLRLAVEHGMGGRNGQKMAIDFLNYVYEYCLQNDNICIQELQDILDEIMDQEFSTTCEDNSTLEIATVIVKFLQLVKQDKYEEIECEINKMSKHVHWLRPDIKIDLQNHSDSSSGESESDTEMEVDVDLIDSSTSKESKGSKQTTSEDGWTTVTYKK